MSLIYKERPSDSPYVEMVTHGWTVSDGSTIRPAESHWHMVFVRVEGRFHPLMVGCLPTSGEGVMVGVLVGVRVAVRILANDPNAVVRVVLVPDDPSLPVQIIEYVGRGGN